MSKIYKVLKKQCRDALIDNTEATIELPMSSIDYNYSVTGAIEYLKNAFQDEYKVKFIEPDKIRLKYRPKLCSEPTPQQTLEEQTKKLLKQFPDVKKVEYIQVGDDYRRKARRKKKNTV